MGRLAVRYGIVDRPVHRKIHHKTTPYLGGAAVFLSLLLVLLALGGLGFVQGWMTPEMAFKGGFILLCSLGVMVVGLLDDATDFGAKKKLLGQALFAVLFAVFGFRLDMTGIPGWFDLQLPVLVTVPLTVFWILAMINATNMVDGVDGLCGSVSLAGLFLAAIGSAHLSDRIESLLAMAGAGAVLAFLLYNWKPAKIYLGDSGSNGLGMFLACLLVGLGHPTPAFLAPHLAPSAGNPIPYAFFILTLLNFYPALEILLSVIRRSFHGRPLYKADQGHIHHRLMKKGFSAPHIALLAGFFMFLPGGVALFVILRNHGLAAWLLVLTALLVGISLSLLNFLDFLHPAVMRHARPHYRIADHFITMQRLKLEMVTSREELLALVSQTCQEFGVLRCRLIVAPDPTGRGGLDYYKEWNHNKPAEFLDFLFTQENPDLAKFTDRCRLQEPGHGAAEWTFDIHDREDEDLDVFYLVLMNEFMRSVLGAAYRIGKNKPTMEYRNEIPPALRAVSTHSRTLRDRHKSRIRRDVAVGAQDGDPGSAS